MGKEVSKRESFDILYEPAEPLFPDGPPPRRLRIGRLIALVLFVCAAVCIWTLAASGSEDLGSETQGETRGEVEYTSEAAKTEKETVFHSEQAGHVQSEGESDYESEDESEDESEKDTEDGENEQTERETDANVTEADLSQIEKGEDYVINYADKPVDVSGLNDRGFIGRETAGGALPLVLVIHTHTSENYTVADGSFKGLHSVVSAGEALTSSLNLMGISTVHCTVINDGKGENAYSNARETIRMMMEIYPSIKYVIDVHRLSLYSDGIAVKTVSGERDGSAQIRLTVGAREEYGNWQEDLSLSLELRKSLNQNGGRVCMPAVVSPGLPNCDLSDYYLMAEIGSVGNSVEEAIAAAKRLGIALASVLLGR